VAAVRRGDRRAPAAGHPGTVAGGVDSKPRTEVAAIKRLTKEIEQGEAAIEAAKWDRAERLATLAADGYSRRDIAGDTGLSATTVSTAIRTWEAYGVRAPVHRPRYAEAYYEISGRGPGFGNSEPAIVAGTANLQVGVTEAGRRLGISRIAVHKIIKRTT